MPVAVSLAEALASCTGTQDSKSNVKRMSPKKLSLSAADTTAVRADVILAPAVSVSSLEPRKIDLPLGSLLASSPRFSDSSDLLAFSPKADRTPGGSVPPPPVLPPFLPADALTPKRATAPPSLPASMPPLPPPEVASLELPAPPTKPPSSLEADDIDLTGDGMEPKLLLPCKILRFGSDEDLPQVPAASQFNTLSEAVKDDMMSPSFVQTRRSQSVKFPPGLQPPPDKPSHGSLLHGHGVCRPCAWFWKPSGCQNGADCGHCHLCPVGEIKARKKVKQTIMRLGLATPKVSADSELDDDDEAETLLASSMVEAATEIEALLVAAAAPVICKKIESDYVETGSKSLCSEYDASTTGSERDTNSPSSNLESTSSPTNESETINIPPGLIASTANLKAIPTPGKADRADRSQLPSKGSAAHASGDCRPCAWFWKASGCQTGRDCKYCHLCTSSELKSRKKSKLAIMRLGLLSPKEAAKATVPQPMAKKTCQPPPGRFSLSLASLLLE